MHLPTPLTLFLAILAPVAVFAAPADDHKGGPPSGVHSLPSGVSFPSGPHGTGTHHPHPSGGPSGGPHSHHGHKPTGTDFPMPTGTDFPKPTGTDFPLPPSGLPLSSS